MKLPTINATTERPTRAKEHVVAAHAAVEDAEKKGEKEEKVRLNVELPGALHRAVKMRAAQEGKSIKEVVLTFLAEYSK